MLCWQVNYSLRDTQVYLIVLTNVHQLKQKSFIVLLIHYLYLEARFIRVQKSMAGKLKMKCAGFEPLTS